MTSPARDSRVRLRPADPFDLIRLIARTQSDPRKAIAELVQNSLDANAKHVHVTWFSHGRRRAIQIHDDGEGVFPAMERVDALERIATTIGHSHKKNLDAAERHRQMMLGKYGIGLLGFWSVGRQMEIKTRVAGAETWTLTLVEDQRDGEVRRARGSKLSLDPTITEVTITDIHPSAEPQVKPKRLAAYLATELRGQLLQRHVTVEIHDKVARGLAQKRIVVRPQRYRGTRIEELRELEIPGFSPAQVELYLLAESEAFQGRARLACGGTVVLDDLAQVSGQGEGDEPRAPWSAGRFDGAVDFPDLEVAPATRRGFIPNAAADAFLAALPALESKLAKLLEDDAARREQEAQANDAKDLRKLFKRLTKSLPQYTLFQLADPERAEKPDESDGSTLTDGAPLSDEIAGDPSVDEILDAPVEKPETAFLFPPGALVEARIKPARSIIGPFDRRKLVATAHDADGRKVADGVVFAFALEGPGTIEPDSARSGAANRIAYVAPEKPGEATIRVTATQGAATAEATATLSVRDDLDANEGDSGVPDPTAVEAPGEPWRSRLLDAEWQYNSGHTDYHLVRDDPKRRLRYLALLFAKEIVQRNFGSPMDSPVLERMVEVITHLELGEGKKERGGKASS